MGMLETLHLTELFPKFTAAMIKVCTDCVSQNLCNKIRSATLFYKSPYYTDFSFYRIQCWTVTT